MTPKKKYEAPAVKKVQLAINNAILATCHSSTSPLLLDVTACSVIPICAIPPA